MIGKSSSRVRAVDQKRFLQDGLAAAIVVSIIAYLCQMMLHASDFAFFGASLLGLSLMSFWLYRFMSLSDVFRRRCVWFISLQVALLAILVFMQGDVWYLVMAMSPLVLFIFILLPGLCLHKVFWKRALFVFMFLVLTYIMVYLFVNLIDLESLLHIVLAKTYDLEFVLDYFVFCAILLLYVWVWDVKMHGK